MKKTYYLIIGILIIVFLAACKAPAPESEDEADQYAVFTAAALTAQAKGDLISTIAPSPTSPSSSQSTPMTGDDPTATPAAQTTDSPPQEGNAAEFVRDISIPDETEMPPNSPFTKTWLLKNVGTTTWTTGYSLVFVGGDRMNAPDSVPLTKSVPPGETIHVSVELVSPDAENNYVAYYNLSTQDGDTFGVGVSGIEAFWVDIIVDEDAAPIATATPAVSPEVVTQNFLYVDAAAANTCPHTYKFTYIITLSEAAPVTYQLVAETVPRSQADLPDPVTTELAAGTHTFEYELDFNNPISGWIAMHVIFPGDQLSNTVNISLNCE